MLEVDLGHAAAEQVPEVTDEDLIKRLVLLPVGGRISTDFGDMVRESAAEFKFEINRSHYEGVVKTILDGGRSE